MGQSQGKQTEEPPSPETSTTNDSDVKRRPNAGSKDVTSVVAEEGLVSNSPHNLPNVKLVWIKGPSTVDAKSGPFFQADDGVREGLGIMGMNLPTESLGAFLKATLNKFDQDLENFVAPSNDLLVEKRSNVLIRFVLSDETVADFANVPQSFRNVTSDLLEEITVKSMPFSRLIYLIRGLHTFTKNCLASTRCALTVALKGALVQLLEWSKSMKQAPASIRADPATLGMPLSTLSSLKAFFVMGDATRKDLVESLAFVPCPEHGNAIIGIGCGLNSNDLDKLTERLRLPDDAKWKPLEFRKLEADFKRVHFILRWHSELSVNAQSPQLSDVPEQFLSGVRPDPTKFEFVMDWWQLLAFVKGLVALNIHGACVIEDQVCFLAVDFFLTLERASRSKVAS